MATETKQCPFCAETIQSAAIVCRYCGRDLTEKPATIAAVDRALIQQEVARLTSQGWQVVSQTETTVQLKRSREWSKPGVVLFVALPLLGAIFYGPLLYVAIFGLLLILADYLMKKEQLVFINADQLQQRGAIDPASPARKIAGALPGSYQCSRCGREVREFSKGCAFCKQLFVVEA